MNNMIKFLAVFAVGSLAGSAVTYAVLKAEYERRVTEAAEIAEERAMQRNALDSEQLKKTQGELEELREQIIHKEIKEYNDIIEKHDYTTYAKQGKEEPKVSNPNEPYVISVEDFADMEDYEIKYLTYYADGLLADSDDDPVDDAEGLAGYKFIDCFGEDDVVYVRNDRLQCDLEITRDYRTLKEVREESYS